VASEVVPRLFVGGRADAPAFRGVRISVLEDLGDPTPAEVRIPILVAANGGADRRALDRAADVIAGALRGDQPVLVYCGHGVRRSPLAVAWFLHRRRGLSFDAAYAALQAQRPEVEPASGWLSNWRELVRDD
jgi:protein-tyrosine phosphatase